MPHKFCYVLSVSILILATLACNLQSSAGTPPPAATAVDATKIALEIQSTQMSLQLTQSALATAAQPTQAPPPTAQPTAAPPVDATKVALEVQATNSAMQLTQQAGQNSQTQPTVAPAPTDNPGAADAAFKTRLKKAKILVYEDTPGIGLWISDALNGMGLKYTHVGDALGNFMENLNSPVQWDLIIVGAESKTKVQGEFWDVIGEKIARDNTAVIAEVWYIDQLGEGRLKPVMSSCGIQFQRDWPLAESIYWLDSNHPLFSDPNTVMPLINYSRYWQWQAGDLIRLAPGSNATLLAGTFQKRKSDYGVMATCHEGRVIFQTFSNHDYHQDAIIMLWQNYITYTLKNRFAVVP